METFVEMYMLHTMQHTFVFLKAYILVPKCKKYVFIKGIHFFKGTNQYKPAVSSTLKNTSRKKKKQIFMGSLDGKWLQVSNQVLFWIIVIIIF